MHAKLIVAAAAILATSALISPAMADGPRASSEHAIPASPPVTVAQAPGWAGPKASSEHAIPPEAEPVRAPAAPHYVLQGGYDHGGKWHDHWVLVQ